MLPTNTYTGNQGNESCIRGVKTIIPEMFQIIPCVKADVFMRRLDWKPLSNLGMCEKSFHEIFMKICSPFFSQY